MSYVPAGEKVFASDVSQVRGILEPNPCNKYSQGLRLYDCVIDPGGSVVPVLDMRSKFGLTESENTVDTCIVVAEVDFGDGHTVVGALLDFVQDVFDIEPEPVGPRPKMGTRFRADFIRGMGRRNDGFVIILDGDKVFSSEEIGLLAGCGDR